MHHLQFFSPIHKRLCAFGIPGFSSPLLSLVCDLHNLRAIAQRHASRILLRADSTRLSFILNESNTSSSRHQTDFSKTLKSSKDRSQSINIIFLRQVLHEENLIRRKVLVRDDCSCSSTCRFETSTANGFDRSCRWVGRKTSGCGALEELLLFCCFGCLFLVYIYNTLASSKSKKAVI